MSKITYVSFVFLIFVAVFTLNINMDLLQTTKTLNRTIELKQCQYNIITTEQRIMAESSLISNYVFEDIDTEAVLIKIDFDDDEDMDYKLFTYLIKSSCGLEDITIIERLK